MLRDELHMMLVEYAEGTLDVSQKKIVEKEIKNSPELRRDLQLIRDTLAQLHVVEDQEVPSYYFSNFLPRLREKLEREQKKTFAVVPLWLRRVLVPAAAVVLAGSGIGLYYLLQPANSNETIYEIVQEINRTEPDEIINYNPLTDPGEPFATNVEDIVKSVLVESDFSKNILASNSLYENVISDGQILTQLNDDEIEMILKRLKSDSVH